MTLMHNDCIDAAEAVFWPAPPTFTDLDVHLFTVGWVFLSHPLTSTASCCCLQGPALSLGVQGTPEPGGCSTGKDVPALQCSVEQQDSSERLGDGSCRWRNNKPRHISWKERPREAVILFSQVVPSIVDGMMLVPARCWSQTTSQLVTCLDSVCFNVSLQLSQNFLAERENLFCFLENWGSPCTLTICFHKIPLFQTYLKDSPISRCWGQEGVLPDCTMVSIQFFQEITHSRRKKPRNELAF